MISPALIAGFSNCSSFLVFSSNSLSKLTTTSLHFSISVNNPFSIPTDLQDLTANISNSSFPLSAIVADNFLLPKSKDVIISCCIINLSLLYRKKIYQLHYIQHFLLNSSFNLYIFYFLLVNYLLFSHSILLL